MDFKAVLRRARLPRLFYYWLQHLTEYRRIPKEDRQKNIEQMQSLKNKFTGSRCFIIGNGPSLQISDLEKLKNEVTFASNRIFSLYNKTDWRPTFFAIQDDLVLKDMCEELSGVIKQSDWGFVSAKHYKNCTIETKSLSNILWMPMQYVPPHKRSYRFSEDVSKQVYEGLTITYSCIQLAAYMGFKEIYLIGVDHNYAIEIDDDGNIIKSDSSIKEYFNEAKIEVMDKNFPKIIEMTRAYISAEKYSRNNGFRIYNATRGGKLEAYQRVDLDEIL